MVTGDFMIAKNRFFVHAFVVCAFLFAAAAVCTNVAAQTAKTDEQISLKAEKQEVQKFVDSFLQSFEESKDLNKVPESYFATQFKGRFSENGELKVNTSKELFAQFGDNERYEHNVSMLNFLYLGWMCALEKHGSKLLQDSNDSDDEYFEKTIPPKVIDLIKKNKTLHSIYVDGEDVDEITNVIELQELVADVKKIAIAQREHLDGLPSGWKSKYDKNAVEARKNKEVFSSELCEKDNNDDNCKYLPENTSVIYVAAIPLALIITRENDELKVLNITIYNE